MSNVRGVTKGPMRDLYRAAELAGWHVVVLKRSTHVRAQSPTGAVVFGPLTPSDHRSVLNVRAKFRRAGLDV